MPRHLHFSPPGQWRPLLSSPISYEERTVSAAPIEWIDIAGLELDIGLQLDSAFQGYDDRRHRHRHASAHVFSLGYMKDDEAKARYFGGLSLFMFSMTGIVLAHNFVMMFIFWELVGLSSYLLIGHWYQKDSAADAAKKAFLTNRIGDFGFHDRHPHALGLTGTVVFADMDGSKLSAALHLPDRHASCSSSAAPSANPLKLPLHVWLPDAMEGPTPSPLSSTPPPWSPPVST